MLRFFLFLICVCACTACVRTYTTPEGALAIPIQLAKPSYPIDIFYENQTVTRNYERVGDVNIEQEVPLNPKQTQKGRMLYRGNDEEQKRALLDQLILQAVGKGANAIINVKYKYYTSMSHQGFTMSGVAVKYSKDEGQ